MLRRVASPDFFSHLETFLGITCTSVLVVVVWGGGAELYFAHTQNDSVELMHRRKKCKSLVGQLFDMYQLDFPDVQVWTWHIHNGSYVDRVFVRSLNRDSISCSQLKLVDYTDHNFVICIVSLDLVTRSFWHTKTTGTTLVKWQLMGAIVNKVIRDS